MKIVGTTIQMLRGDSESLTLTIKDATTSSEIELTSSDVVKFYLCKGPSLATAVTTITATISDGKAIISLANTDTQTLPQNEYCYSIKASFADSGLTKTAVHGKLMLLPDVG